uniref:Lectin n=2 Tax=Cicer arietinum TaxID=3827 RepID=G1K3R9_CICAR|nr:Chain A, Lectin [Cicer arietinum]3V6N_B Chain B, Lectin [Cicer arietinum]4HSD_A Chain A, Lectin [Cicer arietinum]4HSD_B Chain B, Lectin [Cicer arietinum]4LL2_A Chain A, Lectin [Cicer arietinum]4LL2_B Chain B, Lectin [Cicer arietinum]
TKTGYINAAFRSSRNNEAYLFINDKYVLLDYAPGTSNDKVLYGPSFVRDGYKSLAKTIFGTYGIDCSFDTEYNEAFIFYENFCARIDYAPHSDKDKIISGPKKIADMFPFFKGTVFENGIDAAFRSTKGKEVYLFKGDKYARIDYLTNRLVQNIKSISDGFPCLRGTIFEAGMDSAFASHKTNEAYLFKGEYYARINFTPGSTNDIMGGVKKTLDYWPSLRGIIPLE